MLRRRPATVQIREEEIILWCKQHKNFGAVPEEKPDEEKKSEESADITAFNAKAKA
ncbi:hypothetical protein VPNG_06285 [Cytospora leucostoma]|uniref:Uncharacterized protein n=1 Tax=Cytospora leucostoma TaxID=1230097 RepID=A0A423X223_9PEZI|nr:hypothetical protein VPNG_06285 [Cytospora leucostoma]